MILNDNLPYSKFVLPPSGSFTPTGPSDPLPYYYMPIIGKLYVARINCVLSLLPFQNKLNKVLEIGYGSGILIPTLLKISNEYTGIDIDSSPEIVLSNLSKLGCESDINLIQGDVNSINLDQFDLIFAISVFEHIRDLKPLLKSLVKHLSENGLLLIGMPRVDRFMSRMFQLIGFTDIEHHHFTSYFSFMKQAKPYFRIINEAKMPGFLGKSLNLYHAALLQKKR